MQMWNKDSFYKEAVHSCVLWSLIYFAVLLVWAPRAEKVKPSGYVKIAMEMAIEIVSFPTKTGGSFHSDVNVYQMLTQILQTWEFGAL